MGVNLLSVLVFAPRGFSPGCSGLFGLSLNTNISKFQFDQEWQTKNHCVDVLPLNRCLRHVKRYGHSNNLSSTLGMISNCPIPPKTSFTYIFRVNDKPGTYFYHGHLGGIRAAGLYGVLIIDPEPGESEQWSYDGEHTLLLSDWYHAIQHELSIGLLQEEFRWAGMRAQFLTKLVLLLLSLQPRP